MKIKTINLREYNNEYYQKNKDKILKRKKKKIECDNCGLVMSACNMPNHRRTLKCKEISKIPNIYINDNKMKHNNIDVKAEN